MNIENLYLDPKKPGSFSGITSFTRELKRKNIDTKKLNIKKFFQSNESASIHRQIRKKFLRNKTIVPRINHTWQADLIDLSTLKEFNDGFKWLLSVIDVFSKQAYVIPLKDKTAKAVVDGFKQILTKSKHPKFLQTDKVQSKLIIKF